MDLYNINFYLENKQNWYLDIPRIIAQKSTRLWLGKGILLQSEDKKLLDNWNNFYYKDKIFEKLAKFGIQNSLLGRCILLWMITKTGELTLVVPTPTFMSRVAKINEQEQSAELFFTNNQADNQTLTWVTITPKIVHVEIFNNVGEETILGTTKSKTKPENLAKTSYTLKNPFGFLPIVEITNLPNPLLFGQSTTLNGYPDCMSVYPLIEDLNHNIKQKRKERILNQTRAFGQLSNEQLLELMTGKSDIGQYVEDFFMNVSSTPYDKNGNGGINFIQGNPKFSEYWLDYNGIIKQIFNGAGYDIEDYNGQQYTNKTQSMFNNKFDMETTEFKIAHYKPYILRLMDMWMYYYGHWNMIGERTYSFDFIPIAMTDQLQEKELIQFQLDYGLMSKKEAIGKLRNVNLLQSNNILKEINTELKEDIKLLGENKNEQTSTNSINETSSSTIEKTTTFN